MMELIFKKRYFLAPLLVLFISVTGCSSDESAEFSKRAERDQSPSVSEVSEEAMDRRSEKFSKKSMKKDSLKGHFIPTMKEETGRSLEYHISIHYKSSEFFESRKELLTIVGKYGYMKSSSSTLDGESPWLNSEFYVKAGRLYEALLDCDKIGILKSENIRVIDHTESLVLNKRKLNREDVRIRRRKGAITKVSPVARSWTDRENSLQRSEDAIDRSKHNLWKIKDKISWAKINLTVEGEQNPHSVEVPNYKNAFVGLVNNFLNIIYAIIWVIPYLLLITLIIVGFKLLRRKFPKKRNQKDS